MQLHKLKTHFKKGLIYLSLGSCTTVLILLFGLGRFSTLATIPTLHSSQLTFNETTTSPSPFQLLEAGLHYYQSGQFTDAITVWQQAAHGFATQGDRFNHAKVLSNLALAYHQLGRWSEANEAINRSLQLLQIRQSNTDYLEILAQAFNTKGKLQLAQGEAEEALTTWEKATEIYEQAGDQAGVIHSLINQAQAMRVLGFYQRVKTRLEQAEQILQNQPDSAIKAAILVNLGDTLRLVGDFKKSDELLEESLDISQELQSKPAISAALLSLGNTAYSQKEFEAALNYYQQAIASSTSQLTILQAQLNQLRLFIETEKWTDAHALRLTIQNQLPNLPISRTSIYARINFTQSLMKLSNQDTSIPKTAAQILATSIQQAKELGDPQAQSYALGYLGQIYEQTQQWSEAQALTEQALLLSQSTNARHITYLWQWQLGRLLTITSLSPSGEENKATYRKAIAAYQAAINTLNSLRNDLVATNLDLQFSFRESVEPVYRQLVGLLLQPTHQEISQENLQQAREVIESLQLAELDNFFREACLNTQPQSIDQIDPEAAVIYPIILPDRLEVILSLPNQPLQHYTTSILQRDLEDTLSRMRSSLRRTASDDERLPLFQEVYNWLIRPVESELVASSIKTLVFALDGSLKNVPMAVLYDGQQYLIQKYNIALTPSLRLLEPRRLVNEKIKLLVGGLSSARPPDFPPLPGVEFEIEQIESKLPAQVLLNEEFTSTAFQKQINAASFPVVHLATHGQFSSNAENTFILAWDQTINVKQLGGLLQGREESERQPIELLVLSACQTAAGDNRAALGLAGVAVRSGARSTLATLWSVDDQSTSFFMVEFYKILTQSSVTKAQALRHAQLILLEQPRFRHPYYWAPFVLVGNWL